MREDGLIIVEDPGSDKPVAELPTVQCVHCGSHYAVRPGSGKIRGWCMRCNGPICGQRCAECVPVERQLENLEAGGAIDFQPLREAVLWDFD